MFLSAPRLTCQIENLFCFSGDALVNYIDGDWNDGFISVLSTLGNKREMRFDDYYSLSTLPAMQILIDDGLSKSIFLNIGNSEKVYTVESQ